MGHGHHHGHGHGHDHPPELCICFHVAATKVHQWCRKTRPRVPSLISQCNGAGTGCGWCIPYLKAIHSEVVMEGPPADIPNDEEYRVMRKQYHRKKGILPK